MIRALKLVELANALSRCSGMTRFILRVIDLGASIVFMALCIKAFSVHFYEDIRRDLESRSSASSGAVAARRLLLSARSTSDRRRLPWSYSRASIPASFASWWHHR